MVQARFWNFFTCALTKPIAAFLDLLQGKIYILELVLVKDPKEY